MEKKYKSGLDNGPGGGESSTLKIIENFMKLNVENTYQMFNVVHEQIQVMQHQMSQTQIVIKEVLTNFSKTYQTTWCHQASWCRPF